MCASRWRATVEREPSAAARWCWDPTTANSSAWLCSRVAVGRAWRALLALLEAEARRAGCHLLKLETGPYRPEALGLYAKSGYERCAPFSHYTNDPLSVFMQKRLDTNTPGAAEASGCIAPVR